MFQVGQPQPAGVAGPGQGHIQQAQVFPQPLAVGLLQLLLIGLQHPAAVLAIEQPGRLVAPYRAAVGNERQKYQRILQPLGFVDGHYLDQVRIALQPQYLLLPTAAVQGPADGFSQIADQRLLPIQLPGRLLQQLGQVQQVGQLALAFTLTDQPLGQAELVHQPVQHGQHTLAQPLLAVATELLNPLLPQPLMLIELLQLGPAQPQAGGGQRRAQRAVVTGVGAGPQPAQHILGLRGGQHRVLVGQVDAAHAPGRQCLADVLRLAAGTHQHRHIRRAHRLHALLRVHKPGAASLSALQHLHHGTGTALGHALAVFVPRQRLVSCQLPDIQGRGRAAIQRPYLAAPPGRDRQEGQRIIAILSEQEGTAGPVFFCFGEHVIDRIDHGLAGTEVGVQTLVPPIGGAPGLQIGMDIRAAERVDRLLGIADQQQRGVLLVLRHPVDAVEDTVLQRVGILELVDQRHRKLAADHRRQPLAIGALQRGIQPGQHVIEAHLRAALFFLLEALMDPVRGMHQGVMAGVGQFRQTLFQLGHGVQRGTDLEGDLQFYPFPAGGGQSLMGKVFEPALAEIQLSLALTPTAQLVQTGLVVGRPHHVGFEVSGLVALITENLQFLQPLLPGLADLPQRCLSLRQHGADQLLQIALLRCLGAAQPASGLGQQLIRALPVALDPGQGRTLQHVAVFTPVIPYHLGQQLGVVGFQTLLEQAAAVEGMLAQHALTPAVDGGYRCLIHPLPGNIQLVGAAGMQCRVNIFEQTGEYRVRLGQLAAKGLGGLHQTGADTIAQLLGSGIGKGYYQNFRWQQLPAKPRLPAVAENQPQIQGGNGEGLAGTGAGLDQTAATQRATQCQGGIVAHACSSPARVMVISLSVLASSSG